MSRPLRQLGIADLEAMFQGEQTDSRVLRQLEIELGHRQVPRAVALFNKVRAIQLAASKEKLVKHAAEKKASGGTPAKTDATSVPHEEPASASTSASPTQADLWTSSTSSIEVPGAFVTPIDVGYVAPDSSGPASKPASRAESEQGAQSTKPSEATVEATMTLREAMALLKTSPEAKWESIEQVRRTLVDLASPSKTQNLSAEDARRALAEARQLNAAYLLLARNRYVQF